MKAHRPFVAAVALAFFAACAALGTTPEAQIKTSADSIAASAKTATALLQRGKISAAQARNYQAILASASKALDTSAAALVECRARTASTSDTSPDPCKTSVSADLTMASQILLEVETALKAQQ